MFLVNTKKKHDKHAIQNEYRISDSSERLITKIIARIQIANNRLLGLY